MLIGHDLWGRSGLPHEPVICPYIGLLWALNVEGEPGVSPTFPLADLVRAAPTNKPCAPGQTNYKQTCPRESSKPPGATPMNPRTNRKLGLNPKPGSRPTTSTCACIHVDRSRTKTPTSRTDKPPAHLSRWITVRESQWLHPGCVSLYPFMLDD